MRGDRQKRRRRGFLVWETLFGLIIAVVLLMVIAATVSTQRRNENHLAARRAASRTCEEALVALRTGEKLPDGVRMEMLETAAPAKMKWVRVETTVRGKTETMVGLVPGGGK